MRPVSKNTRNMERKQRKSLLGHFTKSNPDPHMMRQKAYYKRLASAQVGGQR